VIGATVQAKVERSIDDSQASWESAKGVLSAGGWLGLKQSGWKQNGWTEVNSDI